MNPANGRFVSQDSYEGALHKPLTLNKYIYAGANPVNNTDPSGNDFTLTETMEAVTINDILLASSPMIGYVARDLIRKAKGSDSTRANRYMSWTELAWVCSNNMIKTNNPDGKTYFTHDFYFSSNEAWTKLALPVKPDLFVDLTLYVGEDELVNHSGISVEGDPLRPGSGGGTQFYTEKPVPFYARFPIIIPIGN
jgi:hypothetical protein